MFFILDCAVCLSPFPMRNQPVTTECQHQRTICPDCLQNQIRVAVETGSWRKLYCSEVGCKKPLTYLDIKAGASPEILEQYDQTCVGFQWIITLTRRYDKLITDAHMKSDPRYRQCNRPDGSCTAGQLHEGGGQFRH